MMNNHIMNTQGELTVLDLKLETLNLKL